MKKIFEQTLSSSSGSFETPMGSGMVKRKIHPFFDIDSEEVQPKKKKKQLNKKKKQMKKITVSEIENIILKTLIQEEVYSEKPIEPKGKDISSKNVKSGIASKTAKKINDITVKSGKESKSDVSVRNKKVSASLKNNLKNAEVKDVNKDKKVNDDYETEAYQNGMEDVTYERISDEQKVKNVKNILSPEMRKSPNAEKSGKAAEKMIKQAKKRADSRLLNPLYNTYNLGGDMEFLHNQDRKQNPRKKLAFENVNTMKRLTFKNQFRDDKDMLKKIPLNYKQNNLVFEMYDGDSNYKVRWEGTETYGTGVIIEHKNASKEMKNLKMFESLNKFDTLDFQSERNVQSSKLNENQMFKQMLNQSRKLMNEQPLSEPETPPETTSSKIIVYFQKLVGINEFKPETEQAGIDTGIKNNLPYDFKVGEENKNTIIVPAPTEAVSSANLEDYNKILRGEAPYRSGDENNKLNFKISFDGETYKALDSAESVEKVAFMNSGATATGVGMGRPLTDVNTEQSLLTKINTNLNKELVIIPAPDVKIASNPQQVTQYNDSLITFVKNQYPKLGVDIEWSSMDGLSFIDGKYKIKGEASNILFNFFNDKGYTYMKIGNDLYFQKRNTGKNMKEPKQYTKVNPTTQGTAYDAIKNLQFTSTGLK
jgi:hypothetical protein